MLRSSLISARALAGRPVAAASGRQLLPATSRTAQRSYADIKKPVTDPKPPVLPAKETTTAASAVPPPPVNEASVKKATIPAENIPLTPPAPPASNGSAPPSVPPVVTKPTPAPVAPLPKKRGFFRRLRNTILTLSILGALAFGGGLWYSRINDNFHDFFTEYVPYGEQAVLYLEEMDFRKRFPNVANRVRGVSKDEGSVKIPAQSGASWRVADTTTSRQSSAIVDKKEGKVVEKKEKKPVVDVKKEAPKEEKKPEPKKQEELPVPVALATAVPTVIKDEKPVEPKKAAPVETTSKLFPPASPIDPLAVPGATEPVIQDLVHMLNDIIAVINADHANGKYARTIGKAKDELAKVNGKIQTIKEEAENAAANQLKSKTAAFDTAANDLISRVEAAMAAQEEQFRRQFEEEMASVSKSFEERLALMTAREKQVHEEKMNNRLLQQAVDLSRQFARDLEAQVEKERDGRLGRLAEMSTQIGELEKLTAGWNAVVDTNLRTQQLHVALDAVRATLKPDNAVGEQTRPFVRELVALKEIANEDPVVDAAIASIHPSAYQRGVPTAAGLVDRFRRVATEVRKAALLPEDAGVASHASSWALSKVLFRKEGLAAGDDVESVLTRAQTLLEEGDLDGAAREVNGLKGWAKTLSRDWLGEVRRVLEVQQAMDVIATEARLQSLRVD